MNADVIVKAHRLIDANVQPRRCLNPLDGWVLMREWMYPRMLRLRVTEAAILQPADPTRSVPCEWGEIPLRAWAGLQPSLIESMLTDPENLALRFGGWATGVVP